MPAGEATSVLDWRDRLVCSHGGSRAVDMVVTGRGEANLYNLCSFFIIEEMRRPLLALWRRCHTRMLVLGHSAGGHLTAAL